MSCAQFWLQTNFFKPLQNDIQIMVKQTKAIIKSHNLATFEIL